MEKVLEVSRKIWDAFQTQDMDVIKECVHEDAMFVHMGVTLTRAGEIDYMEQGIIITKKVDFEESTVKEMESTVILLNKLKLTAVVYGNEVTNPFVVTEVYTKNGDTLKLASLSYTRINY